MIHRCGQGRTAIRGRALKVAPPPVVAVARSSVRARLCNRFSCRWSSNQTTEGGTVGAVDFLVLLFRIRLPMGHE